MSNPLTNASKLALGMWCYGNTIWIWNWVCISWCLLLVLIALSWNLDCDDQFIPLLPLWIILFTVSFWRHHPLDFPAWTMMLPWCSIYTASSWFRFLLFWIECFLEYVTVGCYQVFILLDISQWWCSTLHVH